MAPGCSLPQDADVNLAPGCGAKRPDQSPDLPVGSPRPLLGSLVRLLLLGVTG